MNSSGLRLGLHIDPFSSATRPYCFDGDPTSRREGEEKIDRALRLVDQTKADLVYLDVSKAYLPPMTRGHMTAGGFWALVAAGVPAAAGLLARLPVLTDRVAVLWYMGNGPGSALPPEVIVGIYEALDNLGVGYVAQDYAGTAKGDHVRDLHVYNRVIPTLVEGPADEDADGDDLLELGCVLPTSSWFRWPRAQQHKGLKVAVHNVGPNMHEIDDEVYRPELDQWTQKLPAWCDDCRGRGFVPVLAPYGQPAGYDWRRLGASAAPAPAEKA